MIYDWLPLMVRFPVLLLLFFSSPNRKDPSSKILCLVLDGSGWFIRALKIMSRAMFHISENAYSHHKHMILMQRHNRYHIVYPPWKRLKFFHPLKYECDFTLHCLTFTDTFVHLCWTTYSDTRNCMLWHCLNWENHVSLPSLSSKHKLQWHNSFPFALVSELATVTAVVLADISALWYWCFRFRFCFSTVLYWLKCIYTYGRC